MADDKLKAGPESPGEGSVGDAQTVTKPPVPETVEEPAAGTDLGHHTILSNREIIQVGYDNGKFGFHIVDQSQFPYGRQPPRTLVTLVGSLAVLGAGRVTVGVVGGMRRTRSLVPGNGCRTATLAFGIGLGHHEHLTAGIQARIVGIPVFLRMGGGYGPRLVGGVQDGVGVAIDIHYHDGVAVDAVRINYGLCLHIGFTSVFPFGYYRGRGRDLLPMDVSSWQSCQSHQ